MEKKKGEKKREKERKKKYKPMVQDGKPRDKTTGL